MFGPNEPQATLRIGEDSDDVGAPPDLLVEAFQHVGRLHVTALQEVLEVEMTEALGAEKGERNEGRLGYRSG